MRLFSLPVYVALATGMFFRYDPRLCIGHSSLPCFLSLCFAPCLSLSFSLVEHVKCFLYASRSRFARYAYCLFCSLCRLFSFSFACLFAFLGWNTRSVLLYVLRLRLARCVLRLSFFSFFFGIGFTRADALRSLLPLRLLQVSTYLVQTFWSP